MQFVIFDFEWNCVTLGKDRHLNEIIEIGAVKLDEKFKEIDRFSSFVRPKFTNKLNKYVKSLTHINEEDLKKASDFVTVLSEFEEFSSTDSDLIADEWNDETLGEEPASTDADTTNLQFTSPIVTVEPTVATNVCATVLIALTPAAFAHFFQSLIMLILSFLIMS